MIIDYRQLVRDVTVDECDRAFEVYRDSLAHMTQDNRSSEKAFGCIWRVAQLTARMSLRHRREINAEPVQAQFMPTVTDNLEPIEEVNIDE